MTFWDENVYLTLSMTVLGYFVFCCFCFVFMLFSFLFLYCICVSLISYIVCVTDLLICNKKKL